jgi:hypothetical protein
MSVGVTAAAASGTVKGSVTAAVDGSLLANVKVNAVNAETAMTTTVVTATDGTYTVSLPPGSYRFRTSNAPSPYLNGAYDGVVCGASCSSTAGAIVAVSDGGSVTIGFALQKYVSLAGTVTLLGGNGVAGVRVQATNEDGVFPFVTTEPDGSFVTQVSPGKVWVGTPYARLLGYLNAIYRDLVGGSVSTDGTPIVVPPDIGASGIRLTLTQPAPNASGSITGKVVGIPLSGAKVTSHQTDSVNAGGSQAMVQTDGSFTASGLDPAKTYYLAVHQSDHVSYVYGGGALYLPFPGGSPVGLDRGTPVAVGSDLIITVPSGRIEGAVLANGSPVSGAIVELVDNAGNLSWGVRTTTRSDGRYSLSGLPTGSYFVVVPSVNPPYAKAIYPGTACTACIPTERTGQRAVSVEDGQTTTGIDISLSVGALLSGTVRDADTGLWVSSQIYIFDDRGRYADDAYFDGPGTPWSRIRLSPGTYYLKAMKGGYIDTLYDGAAGTPCLGCDVTQGRPVVVQAETTLISGLDFALKRAPSALNDDCENATAVTLAYDAPGGIGRYSDLVSTATATRDSTDPVQPCGTIVRGRSIWYRFDAPADGTIQVSANGSHRGLVVSAHEGACGAYTAARACGLYPLYGTASPPAPTHVVKGTTYLILVTSTDDTGDPLLFKLAFIPRAETLASVTSSRTPSIYGQQVSYTAAVSIKPPGSGTLSGTVTFNDGDVSLATIPVDASGQAVLTTSALAAGSHAITAEYGGTLDFHPSSSAPVTQVVSRAGTVATLTSAPNPSAVGRPVTFSVTVAGVSSGGSERPSGGVQFVVGKKPLGTAVLSGGVATVTVPILEAGQSDVKAIYPGDGNYVGSTSNTVTQKVTGKGKK